MVSNTGLKAEKYQALKILNISNFHAQKVIRWRGEEVKTKVNLVSAMLS